MFHILLFMFAGILLGRATRRFKVPLAGKATTPLVWALLLILGLEAGSNPQVTGALHTLGTEALTLTAGALAGSTAAAWALWRLTKRGGRP